MGEDYIRLSEGELNNLRHVWHKHFEGYYYSDPLGAKQVHFLMVRDILSVYRKANRYFMASGICLVVAFILGLYIFLLESGYEISFKLL